MEFSFGLIPSSDFSKSLKAAENRTSQFLNYSCESQLKREINSMFDNGKVYADRLD